MAQSGGRYSWGEGDGGGAGAGSQEASPRPTRSPARLAALHLPAYVRRKLGAGQGSGGRVASSGSIGSSSEGGFRSPSFGYREPCRDQGDQHRSPFRSPYKDPLMEPLRDSIRDPLRDPYRSPHKGDPYRSPHKGDPYRSPHKGDPYRSPRSGDPYRSPHKGDPYRSPHKGDPYRSPHKDLLRGPYRDQYRDPLQDPLVDPIRDPLRGSARDLGGYGAYNPDETERDPPQRCYLDLFDPSITVIRDPALDRPPPPRTPLIRGLTQKLGPLVGGRTACCLTLLLLSLSLLTVLTVSLVLSLRGGEEGDPRYQHPHVTAVTACGLVRGRMVEDHLRFQGVPYAVPPTSSPRRRFQAALPITRLQHCWNGTYDATVSRRCWEYDAKGDPIAGSEDCLLLDIYTPKLGYDTPLPVVVYVGGSSMGGDPHRDAVLRGAGPLSSSRQLVIVAPNIRRGALGVMAHPRVAEDVYPHSAGGQGASDLVAALVWVARNIEHFGGDPNSVTLLGHRAGAALAYPLLSSTKTRGLIHRAWLTGAPPLHPHLTWRNAPDGLARPYNCSQLQCLQETPARDVMAAVARQYRQPLLGRPWLLADGVFVSFVPANPSVPVMLGTTLHAAAEALLPYRSSLEEGLDHSSTHQQQQPLQHPLQQVEDVVTRVLSTALLYNSNTSYTDDTSYYSRYPSDSPWYRPPPPVPQFPREEARAAVKLYSHSIHDPWTLLVTLISDAMFTCPFLDLAVHLSRHTTIPPHLAPPGQHHLPQQQHIIPSSGHPVLLHQSTYSVFSYLANHTRRTPLLGEVADANSDIDAIFGVFGGRGNDSSATAAAAAEKEQEDKSYGAKLQDMFSLFVELGKPERTYSTPAHVGSYVTGVNVEVEKRRTMCKFWERWKDLAKRY